MQLTWNPSGSSSRDLAQVRSYSPPDVTEESISVKLWSMPHKYKDLVIRCASTAATAPVLLHVTKEFGITQERTVGCVVNLDGGDVTGVARISPWTISRLAEVAVSSIVQIQWYLVKRLVFFLSSKVRHHAKGIRLPLQNSWLALPMY